MENYIEKKQPSPPPPTHKGEKVNCFAQLMLYKKSFNTVDITMKPAKR
jgi:hypothetical protein